jgi:ABC-type phosphate/phosphonate transport system substrate-binding protein
VVATSFAAVAPARAADVTCWFPPKYSPEAAKRIADALSSPGIAVRPRVAQSYPELLAAFATKGEHVAYVGSFAQAILTVKKQGVPLVQAVDGKEFYGAWMILPKGADPVAVLRDSPAEIAFAKGASSGESGAKAATGGRAALARANHEAAADAVKTGKAKAAFVKSWWWEANKTRFPELSLHRLPGVSDARNPDNVLTASRALDPAVSAKLKAAALGAADAFGARSMRPFDGDLSFTITLMRQGKIDPAAYLFE